MSKPIIVSLEGNIGAGKSTLLEKLKLRYANDKTVVFLREPVDLWSQIKDSSEETMLSKFYKDPSKYSFAFQIMAYTTRLHLLRQLIRENPYCKVIICERSLDADKHIFAKMLHADGKMEDIMYQVYETYFSEYEGDYHLDAVIYVDASAETCFKRIGIRSRDGESSIPLAYLEQCRNYHEAWLKNNAQIKMPVLNIRTDEEANFSDESDPGLLWLDRIEVFLDLLSNKV
jgi:deoxycitidine kinase/deoxyguanosine kinase